MRHITRIETRPSLGWNYQWPRCSCGWDGDIVRTRPLANAQTAEHREEVVQQPALFDP